MSDLERIRTERVLGRRPPVTDPLLVAVRGRWADAVGQAVARNTAPARVSGGALVVACSSASWSAELTLLAPAIAARLREALGIDVELRFEVGEVAPAEEQPARALVPPSPAAEAEARRLAADVADVDLREAIERAIARTLRA